MEQSYAYTDFLKSEYDRRIARNPQYSMRAYARDIGLTPQMLGAVLNKKRDISIETAIILSHRLELNPSHAQDFVDGVILSSCKTDTGKVFIKRRIAERREDPFKPRQLTTEVFRLISDWYHLALLELMDTVDFKSDPKWMASKLGLTAYEVKEALSRLKQLELITDKNGRLEKIHGFVSAFSDVPSAALREHARQILTKALKSLDEQSAEERDITSITMAIDPRKLPEAKRMIFQFRRKLSQFLENGHRTDVYVFSPLLFRLSKKAGPK